MPFVHRDPVWVFAGVDPSGGAGLHQDLRVLTALGLEARGVPTSLTVQNVREVRRVFPVPPGLFCEMTDALREVESPAGIRVGLLPETLFEPLSSFLSELPLQVPVVLDPIFRFGTGAPFLDAGVYRALAIRIFPQASLVIPNLPEASLLLGREVDPSEKEMREAAMEILARYGPGAVYLKGGHAPGEVKIDVYVSSQDNLSLSYPAVSLPALHGGGCTLASLLLGCRLTLEKAPWTFVVRHARNIFQKALEWEASRPGDGRRTLQAAFLALFEAKPPFSESDGLT
ncbi:MAG: bifunctional hydroxymethylpyrimidine kinase/phosphomethylpyrimidine kinase [Leptospirillum sp.]